MGESAKTHRGTASRVRHEVRYTWRALAILLLSLAGMGVSAYLLYYHWSPAEAFCAGGKSCAEVDASPFSEILGVPVSLLGLFMYAGLAGLALLSVKGWRGSASLGVFGLSLVGLLYSVYLTYLEVFVIHAVCLWCATSAVIITVIFALSLGPALREQEL